jgi:putative DNA primase/helicase
VIEQKQPRKDGDQIPTVRKVTASLLTNTTNALTSLRILGSSVAQPGWLNDDEPFPADEVIATVSGLIHIPSFVAGEPSTLAPTPQFFSPNVMSYKFDAGAECPNWTSFLKSLWPDDRQSIECLQEWFGYLLLPDTRQHKLLLLIGPPRSGKGTIGRTLKSLIGERNLASPTLSSLTGNFGLWPLLGKTVALIPEARIGRNADAIAIVERLLSISGEDPQDVHRKNLPTLCGIKLSARFVLMTNELPSLRDSSGAFVNRVVLLRTTQSWLAKEDKQLDSRLQSEMPGILNWAINGWQRLQERGQFLQPDSGTELVSDLNDLSSPVSQFVRDMCMVGPEFETSISELFAAWKVWCDEHGREQPGTRETFGKNLRAKLPGLSVKNRRTPEGRERAYNGIGLR